MEGYETLESLALISSKSDPIKDIVNYFTSEGVIASGIAATRILFPANHVLWVM